MKSKKPKTLLGEWNTDTLRIAVTSERKTVPERLEALGNLYAERNKLYGDNYKHFGKILKGLFPQGITLKDEADFNRFALFLNIMHKTTRYARSVNSGGHADSLDDIAVYSQMLRETDDETQS